jgi:hypothetical protein
VEGFGIGKAMRLPVHPIARQSELFCISTVGGIVVVAEERKPFALRRELLAQAASIVPRRTPSVSPERCHMSVNAQIATESGIRLQRQ